MANLFFLPYRPAYDNAGGLVVPGAQVYFTNTGGTAKPIYSNSGLTIARTNPVVADGVGKLPTGIYMDPAITYRVRIYARGAEVGVDTPLQDFNPYVPGVFADAAALQPVADAAAASATAASNSAAAADTSADAADVSEAAAAASATTAGAAATSASAAEVSIIAALAASGSIGLPELEASGLPLNVKWLGAAGDNVTDDHVPAAGVLALAQALAVGAFAYTIGGGRVSFPKGRYYLGANSFDVYAAMRIEGDGVSGGGSSVLRSAAGATQLRVQSYNTSTGTGASDGHANDGTRGGNGSLITGIFQEGGFTTTEGEFYGTQLRATAFLQNGFTEKFEGDGVRIVATAGGNPEGNANCFGIMNWTSQLNRNGIYVDGADANAGLVLGFNSLANRQWGVWDSSFLGNCYVGCHAASNGIWGDGTAGKPASACSYSGNRYYVKLGQEVGASTNAPSGTATSNTWWLYWSAGAPATGIPAWVSGMSWRAGGSYGTDDINATHSFFGCYAETDQPPPQISNRTLVVGGQLAALVAEYGAGAYVRGEGGKVEVNALSTPGGVTALGNSHSFGPQTGTATDSNLYIDNTNANSILTFRTNGVASAFLQASSTFGLFTNVSAGLSHFVGVVGTGTIHATDASGLDLQTGKVLKVGGTQVVGPRSTGWAADTGTAEKGAHATYTGGTANAAYNQAEITAIRNALQDVSRGQKAIKDMLLAHGLAGA